MGHWTPGTARPRRAADLVVAVDQCDPLSASSAKSADLRSAQQHVARQETRRAAAVPDHVKSVRMPV
jgi:hypothetical protein